MFGLAGCIVTMQHQHSTRISLVTVTGGYRSRCVEHGWIVLLKSTTLFLWQRHRRIQRLGSRDTDGFLSILGLLSARRRSNGVTTTSLGVYFVLFHRHRLVFVAIGCLLGLAIIGCRRRRTCSGDFSEEEEEKMAR